MTRQSRHNPGPSEQIVLGEETSSFISALEEDEIILGEILDPGQKAELEEESHSRLSGGPQFDAAEIYQIYLKAAHRLKLLTADEEQYFGYLTQQGDEAARQTMIESNLRLVLNISRRYLNRGLPLMDMIEEGNIGLIRAVEKFRPELGFRFSTYATWWIRQSIERAIMNQSRTIRMPINVLKEMNACLKVFRHLANSLDHEPTAVDVARHMDKPLAKVEKMLELREQVISGDLPLTKEYERNYVNSITDEDKASLPDILHLEGLSSHISIWLEHLTEMQREVICRRYGLCGYDPASLPEIAKAMDVNRERVRHLQTESMSLLRKMAATEGLSIDSIFL